MSGRAGWHALAAGIATLASAGVLAAGTALADGDVPRAATAAEVKFHARVLQTVIKAIPAAPQGWSVEAEGFRELDTVSGGSEKYPFKVEYAASWNDRKTQAEAEAAMAVAVSEKLKTTPPAKRAEVVNQIMRSMTPRDVAVQINVLVNTFSEWTDPKAAPAASIAGGTVFATAPGENEDGTRKDGVTWICLGKGWKLDTRAGYYAAATPDKGVPPLAVQAIIVRIQADAARMKGIVERIDWEALKGLIGK